MSDSVTAPEDQGKGIRPSRPLTSPPETLEQRHSFALSVLGHRVQPDGTLPADAVADLAELLWGGR